MYRRVEDFVEQYRNLAEGTSWVLGVLTGVFGPATEEWRQYGMEAPPV